MNEVRKEQAFKRPVSVFREREWKAALLREVRAGERFRFEDTGGVYTALSDARLGEDGRYEVDAVPGSRLMKKKS